jgi:hypothetical protein
LPFKSAESLKLRYGVMHECIPINKCEKKGKNLAYNHRNLLRIFFPSFTYQKQN